MRKHLYDNANSSSERKSFSNLCRVWRSRPYVHENGREIVVTRGMYNHCLRFFNPVVMQAPYVSSCQIYGNSKNCHHPNYRVVYNHQLFEKVFSLLSKNLCFCHALLKLHVSGHNHDLNMIIQALINSERIWKFRNNSIFLWKSQNFRIFVEIARYFSSAFLENQPFL